MPTFRLAVNGKVHAVEIADPGEPLLYVLRNALGLHAPKYGCGAGQCGACSVILAGKAVRSCTLPVGNVGTRPITTLEGLGSAEHPHAVQAAFIAEQAAQCGYCSNGMIIGATALLAHTPHPTDAQVRGALAGNLCRCGSQVRVLRAVHRAATMLARAGTSTAPVQAKSGEKRA
jgi:nicotinate dehydrogenase subunit A